MAALLTGLKSIVAASFRAGRDDEIRLPPPHRNPDKPNKDGKRLDLLKIGRSKDWLKIIGIKLYAEVYCPDIQTGEG